MNAFIHALTAAASPNTLTENGAVARSTTGSDVLNLFSQIGGLRGNYNRCEGLVTAALQEDANLTARTVFYSRDVRGGQGEREVFRTNMKVLIKEDPRFKSLIKHVPTYGRWDDVVDLIEVAPEESLSLIQNQLHDDLLADKPSLLAKWLPSENTSSKATIAKATVIRKHLKMSSKQYRQTLTSLRKKIDVVECKMSANKFDEINFPCVPSNAMLNYRKAFARQVPAKFAEYMSKVKSGEAKINSSTLFPYDMIRPYMGWCVAGVDEVLEEQWKAQPDYFNGCTDNVLVLCDVSGSMAGLPMEVSISLGIYAAERSRGVWHNKFMTFTSTPEIVTLRGTTLFDKVQQLKSANWGGSTNIEAAFDAVLKAAVVSNTPPSEMITRLFVISDMHFDAANGTDRYLNEPDTIKANGITLFQTIAAKFAAAGYTMPELVFWNVAARDTQFPMAMDERGFLNVSGCSPTVFKFVLGKSFVTAYDLMLDVICSERYSNIDVTQ